MTSETVATAAGEEVDRSALKGKESVPIEPTHMISNSLVGNKNGTYGPHSLSCTPNSFDFQKIAESHAMDIIDGSH